MKAIITKEDFPEIEEMKKHLGRCIEGLKEYEDRMKKFLEIGLPRQSFTDKLKADKDILESTIKLIIQDFNKKHPEFKVSVETAYKEFESKTGQKYNTGFDVKINLSLD